MKRKKVKNAVPIASPGRSLSIRRRWFLKRAAAAGAVAGIGPWVVRDAFSSSGDLALLMRSYHLPNIFLSRFEKRTGIKVKYTTFDSDAALLTKIKAMKGVGFDLVSPASPSAMLWKPLDILQPFDMNKVPVDRIEPAMLKICVEDWTWGGNNYCLPFLWDTEGLAWRTDKWSGVEHGNLSYGDLWRPEVKGNVMGEPYSMMLGIGLYLDGIGKLPSNRLLDTFKNEAIMRKVWNEITKFAIARKPWVRLFWKDADSQVSGFMHNGVALGQTWAGPSIRLKTAGKPVTFAAPKEGALSWITGLAIPTGAKNVPQIYEFLKFANQAQSGGLLASNTGYFPVCKGWDRFITPATKKSFAEAYPPGSLGKVWWMPAAPPWHVAAQAEFRDKFVTA